MSKVHIMSVVGSAVPATLRAQGLLACWYLMRDGEPVGGPFTSLPVARQLRGGLRIKLKLHGGLKFKQLKLDTLPLFISAPDDVAFRLHELVLGNTVGTWVSAGANGPANRSPASGFADADSVKPMGYDDDQAR